MDEKYEEAFKDLTEGIEIEKIFDKLALRGDFARMTAVHCGAVYKAAREAGLSRQMAAYMAKSYWDFEMSPSTAYIIGDQG
jgi:hypothetical protein